MVTRPTMDQWGLILAEAVATRADCTRRQVGAIIINGWNSVVAEGYNGAPAGETGCIAGGCPRSTSGVEPGSSYDTGPGTCIALHAEQNALLRASWSDMVGSTLYVTEDPCDGCWRMIKGTPIWHVVTPNINTFLPKKRNRK